MKTPVYAMNLGNWPTDHADACVWTFIMLLVVTYHSSSEDDDEAFLVWIERTHYGKPGFEKQCNFCWFSLTPRLARVLKFLGPLSKFIKNIECKLGSEIGDESLSLINPPLQIGFCSTVLSNHDIIHQNGGTVSNRGHISDYWSIFRKRLLLTVRPGLLFLGGTVGRTHDVCRTRALSCPVPTWAWACILVCSSSDGTYTNRMLRKLEKRSDEKEIVYVLRVCLEFRNNGSKRIGIDQGNK